VLGSPARSLTVTHCHSLSLTVGCWLLVGWREKQRRRERLVVVSINDTLWVLSVVCAGIPWNVNYGRVWWWLETQVREFFLKWEFF